MNKEQLIMEAKIRFSVGTKFISCLGTKDTIINNNFYYLMDNSICTKAKLGHRIVYDTDKNFWASIISLPKELQYEIY